MEDDIGQMEYMPARKLKPKAEQKPSTMGRVIGAARGVGGFVKREVQGELQAGKDIARASPRLAERAIISGAKEAKAGTEIAGWVAGKEAGFREWQARREEAKARRQVAQAQGLQTQVSLEKSRFDLARLREAEASVRSREAENQRRANVISGLIFGGQARQQENPFATRHPLESFPISWQLPSMHSNPLLKTAGKRSKGRKRKAHSKGRKITFTDSRGKKISFTAKRRYG